MGAEFAGLWAARTLAGAPVDVVVVARNNYHSFFPLLYQVAAAELEPGTAAACVSTKGKVRMVRRRGWPGD